MKSNQRKSINLGLLSTVTLVLLVMTFWILPAWGKSYSSYDQGPSLVEIQRLAKLSSLKVSVSFIQEAKSESRLGTLHGIWIVHGEATLAIDLESVEVMKKNDRERTAQVRMLLPDLDSVRVNHERTQLYELAGNFTFGDEARASLQSLAMREAERRVRREAMSDESVQTAVRQAEFVIRELYGLAGWDVSVEWGAAE